MEYNYTDLLSLLNDYRHNKELEKLIKYIINYKFENTCLGCFYDKCDQKSHMENTFNPNGCIKMK